MPIEKRMLTQYRNIEDQIDGSTLSQIIANLTLLMHEIGDVEVSLTGDYVEAQVSYQVLETDEQAEKREMRAFEAALFRDQAERRQYEQLKAKFEGKV